MLLDELEGLNQAEDLGSVTSNRGIVHGDVTNVSVGVDEEKSTVGVASVEVEATVGGGDLLVDILNEGDVHLSKTTVLAVSVDPSEVREDRVDRHTNDLSVQGGELSSGLREGNNLGGAHKGEVQGVEEEDNPLTGILRQRDLLDALVRHDSIGGEGRGGLSDARDLDVAVVDQAKITW